MENDATGHTTTAEGAATSADHLDLLDVLGVNWKVEKVMCRVWGTPPNAIDPQCHLLKGSSSEGQVSLGTEGAALPCVEARHGFEESIESRLGRVLQDFFGKNGEVFRQRLGPIGESRLNHGLCDN